ncbi:related to FRE3 - Ferric reductase, reduces siderophore-bound iron prior to uptake [Melanopsichium pennsylvanicum]|uniref:Related to FRE3 - Ferric reductase, reduces siderophore-bound iron prior to uptake n=1 Tax=Melanopsichium pennsylvanicum TaxID=63383 RepID=A0AAJ4XG81_9BASI|nr:related to FRE3 - Ferric reductase, reduces siderophore-bound iron prior to uptake [Melanopsichium pennsylvanicum]
MIPIPWKMGSDVLDYITTLPADEQEPSLLSLQSYYYNSMKVPCLASFALYGLFVVLILATAFNNLLKWTSPWLHNKISQKLRVIRAYVWEHPLLSRSHATVISLPGLRWLTLQLPLRGEAMIILGLFLINFIPLVAFYQLLEPIPGSSLIESKSDQICRALADRTGVLGTAQIPLLILMASKRTPLAIVSDLGQNSLMLYHRWIARWFWAHIFIHGVAYTVVYAGEPDGVSEMLAETYIRWGIVGLAMAFGLCFLSLRALRQRYYEVFVMFHITMAIFAILGTYLHITLLEYGPYGMFKVMTELAAAFWGFDRVVRWIMRIYLSFSFGSRSTALSREINPSIRCTSAQIQAYGAKPDYCRLRITVPASKIRVVNEAQPLIQGVAAGDDIRITIPRMQWVGEHPFTVFEAGIFKHNPSQGYVDLLIKTAGGMTHKLAQHMINSSGTNSDNRNIEMGGATTKQSRVSVLIEGPFGRAPEINQATTDIVLVAGGIAITFCWPLFVRAFKAQVSAAGESNLRSCKLIWIVRSESTTQILEEAFTELVQQVQSEQNLKKCCFTMDVYVTSIATATPTAALPISSSSASIKAKKSIETPGGGSSTRHFDRSPSNEVLGLTVLSHVGEEITNEKTHDKLFDNSVQGDLVKVSRFNGRPKPLASCMFAHLEHKPLERGHTQCLTVAFCGPSSLCDDIRYEAVGLIKKGHNVELIEECFMW